MIDRIHQGDESARNILLQKYFYFSRTLVIEYLAKYPAYTYIRDEIHSIVFAETLPIIDKYDRNAGKFYPYWKAVSLRNIERYVIKNWSSYKGGQKTISLDYSNSDSHSLHEVYGFKDSSADQSLLAESILKIAFDKKTDLTAKEKMIVKYYLEGYDFKEISLLIDVSLSGIYKCYQSAIKKIGVVYKRVKR